MADCLIDAKGRLAACFIGAETPKAFGFGPATLKLTELFRMKLVDAEGRAVANRRLRLPVTWRPPG